MHLVRGQNQEDLVQHGSEASNKTMMALAEDVTTLHEMQRQCTMMQPLLEHWLDALEHKQMERRCLAMGLVPQNIESVAGCCHFDFFFLVAVVFCQEHRLMEHTCLLVVVLSESSISKLNNRI